MIKFSETEMNVDNGRPEYSTKIGGDTMEVFEAIKNRTSIRKYKPEKISKEKIDILIEAGRLAPTAANKQKYKLVIVDDEDIKKRLGVACNNQTFVGTASHVIAGTVDQDWKWKKVDLAIVFEHIVLEALELGFGTCWIGAFSEKEVKKILDIPENIKVVAMLTIGAPDEIPKHSSRKKVEEIVSYNKYR
jgi:nitroreductase